MVIVRLQVANLEVIISADSSQLGTTGGLLGLANGNTTDDFTLRDGSFLPSNSSAEEIYNLFGDNCAFFEVFAVFFKITVFKYTLSTVDGAYIATSLSTVFVRVDLWHNVYLALVAQCIFSALVCSSVLDRNNPVLCSGRISQQESIMWYPPGEEPSSFQDTTFVPMQTPTFSSLAQQQQAEALCGGIVSCLLDFAATGNADVAAATAAFFNASSAAAQILGECLT